MANRDPDKSTDYEFKDIVSNWEGYVSSADPTNLAENVYVGGSQNVYKKLSGTLAVRPGLKLQGSVDSTASPISSEFVWETSWGQIYTMVITKSNLYVVVNNVWTSLMSGLTKTRFVFDKWWNQAVLKQELVFVNGTSNLYNWSGGMGVVDYGTNNASTKQAILQFGGLSVSLTSFGAITGTAPFTYEYNNLVGTSIFFGIMFSANPTNGQTLVLTINGTAVSIQFVSTIGAVAGNVLIGVDLATTITNLLGLLHYTGTTNSTQVAFSGGNQTLMNYLSGGAGAVNTLVKTNPTVSWSQVGFTNASPTVSAPTIHIGSTDYTYEFGGNGSVLWGVSPDPSAIVSGTAAVQNVVTNTNVPNSTFLSDFLKVINNQVYLGSYTSASIFISDAVYYTNYKIPNPRVQGSPEMVVLDGIAKGIGVRQGNACIGYGSSGWTIISFANVSNNNIVTNVTTKTNKPLALLQAPLAHEFIDTVNDNIIYLGQDQQVRQFGDFNTAYVAMYPSLSQEVATELSAETFTGGALKSIGEFIYITAPSSGKVYLRQERTKIAENGTVTSEKLWHSPFTWKATRIDQINGTVVAFSNTYPQIYATWNTGQYHDDVPVGSPATAAYTCTLALSYRGEQRRQGLWNFDKQYTEGYITSTTPLNLTINYNYGGATTTVTKPVNSVAKPAKMYGTKFKCINSLPLNNVFEWQPIYQSTAIDSNWEILAVASNGTVEPDQNSSFIINK